ncbi:MAG: 16S rRNA (cytosine(967)-C(5))-methyltransferase RsmB [Anaerovoracaceae bacterium]
MDKNREIAYKILMDIEGNNAFSNISINKALSAEKEYNSGFIREIVYGVLERKIWIDYLIDQFCKQGIKSLRINEKTILRMGIYQISYMYSVPDYAAVDETVELARKKAKSKLGFINGVLRNYLRIGKEISIPEGLSEEKFFSLKYSCPVDIVKIFIKEQGIEDTEGILKNSLEKTRLFIRVNEIKTSRKRLIIELDSEGITAIKGEYGTLLEIISGQNVLETEAYKQGKFSVQDAASQCLIERMKIKENEKVLDICAGLGGKSLAIAEKMKNLVEIVSLDIFPKKLETILREGKRLGVNAIEISRMDATEENEKLFEKYDTVLVDAPCSGLGVIARKPEIKFRTNRKTIMDITKLQEKILFNAAKYVKAGGKLVYSTCTISKEENQNQSMNFIEKNGKFKLQEEKQLLPHIDGTDGFYYSIYIKDCDDN